MRGLNRLCNRPREPYEVSIAEQSDEGTGIYKLSIRPRGQAQPKETRQTSQGEAVRTARTGNSLRGLKRGTAPRQTAKWADRPAKRGCWLSWPGNLRTRHHSANSRLETQNGTQSNKMS